VINLAASVSDRGSRAGVPALRRPMAGVHARWTNPRKSAIREKDKRSPPHHDIGRSAHLG
jgi:hypothetical protein